MTMIRTPLMIVPFFLAFVLVSCSSATISNQLRTDAVSLEFPASAGISGRSLIGGGGMDLARKVICSSDGRCALFGYGIKSFTESTDFLMAMEAEDHKLLWGKTYGGTHKDELRTAIATLDGGYLLFGESQSLFFTPLKVISPNRPPRPFIVKVDSSGNIQWAETIEPNESYLMNVEETTEGNYIFVGTTYGTQRKQKQGIIVINLAQDGKLNWAVRYDPDLYSYGYVVETFQGGTLMAGNTGRHDASGSLLIAHLDLQGKAVWGKLYSSDERLIPLSSTKDGLGGYLVAGNINEKNGRKGGFIIRISPAGKILWSRSYKRTQSLELLSVTKGHNDDFLLVGRSGNVQEGKQDGCAVLIDGNGIIKTATLIGGNANDELLSASKLGQSQYRLLGDTASFNAKYVDMLSADWNPYSANIAGLDLAITTGDIMMSGGDVDLTQARAELETRPIAPSLLELNTLSVTEQSK